MPKKKPSLKKGISKGLDDIVELTSTTEKKSGCLITLGTAAWLILTPVTCMKLKEIFPGTPIGFIFGATVFISGIIYLSVKGERRKKEMRLKKFGKEKPSIKDVTKHHFEDFKQKWKDYDG